LAAKETDVSLICRAGALHCALPVSAIVETMRPLAIEPLAGTPDFVLGSAIVRGAVLPVLLLGRLLGGEVSLPSRLVIVRAGARRVALAVDVVVGFRSMSDAVARSLPPLLSGASSASIAELGVLDGDLLVVLDAARLIPEGLAAAIEGRASAA
jgi:purine-binding chemotaxis protein CheW